MDEHKSQTQDLNISVAGMASFLVDDSQTERKTFFKEHLKTEGLDFSPDSLKLIDEYLEYVRSQEVSDIERFWIVSRCGAYCGEVIRRNTQDTNWVSRGAAISMAPQLQGMVDDSPLFAAILYGPNKNFSFPAVKCLKFIENGSEDSLWHWGRVLLRKAT